MKLRSGSTLLETSICIPISFAILIGAIGLLQKAMVVTNLAKNQSQARRTIGNLALQFRNDVRDSISAKLEKNSNIDRLILSGDRYSIVYEVEDSVIRRIESTGPQEQYLLPEERVTEFAILSIAERPHKVAGKRIRLTISRSLNRTGNSAVEAEIEAALDAYSQERFGITTHE